MTKIYSAVIAPMRHDDPRKATREARIKARREVEYELKKNELPVQFRSIDYEKVMHVANDMREALKEVDRKVVVLEVMSMGIREDELIDLAETQKESV